MGIRKLRTDKGLSQDQLATEIGVSRQAIIYWEDMRSLPSSKNLVKLAQFFGVPAEKVLACDTYEKEE